MLKKLFLIISLLITFNLMAKEKQFSMPSAQNIESRKDRELKVYSDEFVQDLITKSNKFFKQNPVESEIEKIKKMMKMATDVDIEAAKRERSYASVRLSDYYIGDFIFDGTDAFKNPISNYLFFAFDDFYNLVIRLKYTLNKARPKEYGIQPLGKMTTPHYPSYPSFVSAYVHMFAYLMIELYPCKKEEILSDAREQSLRRVKVGVNFTRDVEFSKILADDLLKYLRKQKEWKGVLDSAQKYWKKNYKVCSK